VEWGGKGGGAGDDGVEKDGREKERCVATMWKEIETKGRSSRARALSLLKTHLDLLNLTLQPSNIRITLRRCLIELHDRHHRIDVVCEHSHDSVGLVVEEDGAAWFEEILVDEGHDGDVVLWSVGGRDDGVVVVDDFLEGSDGHG